MDIFAHGLWAGAVYKAINKKTKKPLNVRLAGFWGIFPDLFAFTLPFVWFFGNIIVGGMSFADLPRLKEAEPAPQDTLPIFRLTSFLYSISHSAVIFLVVFGAVYLRALVIRRTKIHQNFDNFLDQFIG